MTDPSSSLTRTSWPVVFLSIPGLEVGGAKLEDFCIGVVDALAGGPNVDVGFVMACVGELRKRVPCDGVKPEGC